MSRLEIRSKTKKKNREKEELIHRGMALYIAQRWYLLLHIHRLFVIHLINIVNLQRSLTHTHIYVYGKGERAAVKCNISYSKRRFNEPVVC